MNTKFAQYRGYTLAEVLIVLMVIIVLGGLGISSFGGMRDTVLVKQNIEEIKQDLRLAQQKAMLLERKQGEGWIYGIGIDFRNISNGSYKFFKWCSPFQEYGNIRTRTEIVAYNPAIDIGTLDNEPGYYHGNNAVLPVSAEDYESGGFCDSLSRKKYMTNLPGVEDGRINAGFNMGLSSDISFVVFEAVTGKAFLYYGNDGWPVNYDENGNLRRNTDTDLFDTLGIIIFRNRGNIADTLTISPLSGNVNHTIWDNPAILGTLREIVAEQNKGLTKDPLGTPDVNPVPDPVPDPVVDPTPDPVPDPVIDPITVDPLCCVSDPKLGIECITVQCDQMY